MPLAGSAVVLSIFTEKVVRSPVAVLLPLLEELPPVFPPPLVLLVGWVFLLV